MEFVKLPPFLIGSDVLRYSSQIDTPKNKVFVCSDISIIRRVYLTGLFMIGYYFINF